MRLIPLLCLTGAVTVTAAVCSVAAPLQTAAPAQSRAQTRPNTLLDVFDTPVARRPATPPKRPARRPPPKKPEPPKPVVPPPRPLVDSAVVDCGSGAPGALAEALRYLAPNGVIYVRTRGAPCRESLTITRSATLIGDSEPMFTDGQAPASLAPAAGNPCIVVRAAGVAGGPPVVVTIRDMTIDARQSRRASCIQATDATVRLERSTVRYGGDASAIDLTGGALDIDESDISAETYVPAITVTGGLVDLTRTRIRADAVGLDLTVSPGAAPSRLLQVGVLANAPSGRPGETGVLVRGGRQAPGKLSIRNSVICGFNTGATLTWDAQAQIDQSRICRARTGVSSSNGQLTVTQSLIGATDRGVHADGGQVTLTENRILSAYAPIAIEGQAQRTLGGNGYISTTDPSCRSAPQMSGLVCAEAGYSAQTLADEADFNRADRIGWLVDGYERGYLRDGGPPKARVVECQRTRFGRCVN